MYRLGEQENIDYVNFVIELCYNNSKCLYKVTSGVLGVFPHGSLS